MRQPNCAIERERHITPTIDNIINQLNGSSVFSKHDLTAGYHQCILDEQSRYITTFTTHIGLRRYKRQSFGINSASEVFQNEIYKILQGLSGVINVSDDILVHGKNKREHDKNLELVQKRLNFKGVTLNKQKCQFNLDRIIFLGNVFNKSGVMADPEKIRAIKNAEALTSAEEVRSLLGTTNYVSRFIPNYSTIVEPIRRLTAKNTSWVWNSEQKEALTKLKKAFTSKYVMAYFNEEYQT